MKAKSLVVAVAVAGATACGEAKSAEPIEPAKSELPAEVLQFSLDVGQAWARREAECEKAELALATAYWSAYHENQASRVGPGGLLFDGAAAGRCVSAVEALGCHELGDSLPPECAEVYYGTAKVGEACNPGCERGAACRITASSSEPWCTRCVTRLNAGDACTEGADTAACTEGLFCVDGSCARKRVVARGDPCDPFADTVCEAESYCSDSRRCEARQTSGSCFWGDECAPGYGCVNGTCQKWKARGEACESPDECEPHASCSDPGGCDASPFFIFLKAGVGVGQSCAGDPCMSALTCNEQTSVCEVRPACQ